MLIEVSCPSSLGDCLTLLCVGTNTTVGRLEPTLILLLAWALGDVISNIHTANYIASALEVSSLLTLSS